MALFAPIMVALLGGFFDILIKKMTFKLAMVGAFVATITATVLTVHTALAAAWSLAGIVTPDAVTNAFNLVIPSNFNNCASSIITAELIASSYRQFMRIVSPAAAGLMS